MSLTESLLTVSKAYCVARKIVLPTLSAMILRDSRTFDRVAAGASITVRNYERSMEWLSANWPADLPWPAGIDRPTPALPPSDAERAA